MGTQKDAPSLYLIQIKGSLDSSWSDRLGGLQICQVEDDQGQLVSILSGSLIDQAALFGVLNALYDMRYSLVRVEYQGRDQKVSE